MWIKNQIDKIMNNKYYRTYEIHQIKVRYSAIINNCYIIVDRKSKDALIIDPAWELDEILKKLSELNVNLKSILLTHSHYDHVNLVMPLVKLFNSKVYMSSKEINYYKFQCTNLNPVDDLDVINLGETEFKCLLTPGHTTGGMCYFLKDSIFTGDTVFIEGCGMCDTEGGSAEEMFDSIQKLKATLLPEVKIYPGHSFNNDSGQRMDYLLKENIYFQIDEKECFINFRMRKSQKNLYNFV